MVDKGAQWAQSVSLMPAALAVDWNEVKTLAVAIGVRQAARRMGVPVQAAMKRSSREGWLVRQREVDAIAKQERDSLRTQQGLSPHVRTAADILAELGPDSKTKLAIAGNTVANKLAEMSAPKLLNPDTATSAKAWTGILATAHGWADEEKPKEPLVSFTFNSSPVEPIQTQDGCIEVQPCDPMSDPAF